MTKQVYTFGYQGRSPANLKAFAERIDAIIFDIRFSPRSQVPQWNLSALATLLGSRYRHVQTLGNKNYNSQRPIEIVSFDLGLRAIRAAPKPVILMCVCRDEATCHRTAVAKRLPIDMEVREITDADLKGEES